jgi:hypothetical protein
MDESIRKELAASQQAIRHHTEPMMGVLKTLQENDNWRQLRIALGPSDDLREIFQRAGPSDELRQIFQRLATPEAQFRLPEMQEVQRFLNRFSEIGTSFRRL